MTTAVAALSTRAPFDLTYEVGFDGDLGALMSLDAHGHLDDRAVELFMASEVAEELDAEEEARNFGFEVEHLWRTEHPFVCDCGEEDCGHETDAGWTYEYSREEREGAVPVTRFQIASPWSRPAVAPDAPRAERDRRTHEFTVDGVDYWPLLCVHHPDEPAVSGIPVSRFVDGTVGVDGHIHYCRPCLRDYEERAKRAHTIAQAELFLEHTHEGVIARASDTATLTTDIIRGLLAGDAAAVDAAGEFVTAWQAAGGGYRVADGRDAFHLYLSTVQRLIEDATT